MPPNTSTSPPAGQAGDAAARAIRRARNLAAALALAERGLPVFPARSAPGIKGEDKAPVPGFRWREGATADPARVRELWRDHPDAMPALPTGPGSGVTVIDLDVGAGKDGIAAYRALGLDLESVALVVETAGGGRHLYFAHEPAIRGQAGKVAPGVDSRSAGGYVIAPGAVTANGREYRVARGSLNLLEMGLLDDVPAAFPRTVPREAAEIPGAPDAPDLAQLADALHHVPADGGHDEWWPILAALHHATAGSDAGRALAHGWSATDPRYRRAEVDAKWASFGRREGAQVGAGTLYKVAREHGWPGGRVGPDDFDDDDESEAPSVPADSHLTFLTPAECEAADPRPYLVKGLIAQGDVGAIVGAPGVGKSVLAPALAFAVAQGADAFGRRVRQGGVFYVAAEDGHGMRGRLTALKAEHGDAPDLKLVLGVSDLLREDVAGQGSRDFRALRAAVKDQRPTLVIVDTLAMAFPGLEENSAEGMGRVVAVARSLTKWGAAVLLIHHDTKAGDGLPRGHSLLNGALDLSLALAKADGIVTARLTKNRNGPCESPLAFRIKARRIGTDCDGDPVTTAYAEPAEPDAGQGQGVRLTGRVQATLSALHAAAGEGWADRSVWREVAARQPAFLSLDKPDSRLKAFNRALGELVTARLVEAREDAGAESFRPVQRVAEGFDDADD